MRARHRLALVAEIALTFLPVALGLRRRGLHDLLARVRRPARLRIVVPPTEWLETGERLGAIVDHVVDRFPLDNRCLVRSLVLLRLMARRSIPGGILVLGASMEQGFAAHAWVELEGTALLPPLSHQVLTRL